mmetsp:Transcript_65534/g.211345  ORF Transcript_65534/g.211345 Transcript_65534/m.211345 type:complete len:232 (-) Transcript_65534:1052-1747(-)
MGVTPAAPECSRLETRTPTARCCRMVPASTSSSGPCKERFAQWPTASLRLRAESVLTGSRVLFASAAASRCQREEFVMPMSATRSSVTKGSLWSRRLRAVATSAPLSVVATRRHADPLALGGGGRAASGPQSTARSCQRTQPRCRSSMGRAGRAGATPCLRAPTSASASAEAFLAWTRTLLWDSGWMSSGMPPAEDAMKGRPAKTSSVMAWGAFSEREGSTAHLVPLPFAR